MFFDKAVQFNTILKLLFFSLKSLYDSPDIILIEATFYKDSISFIKKTAKNKNEKFKVLNIRNITLELQRPYYNNAVQIALVTFFQKKKKSNIAGKYTVIHASAFMLDAQCKVNSQ